MLDSAAAPEGDRRGAVALHQRGDAQGDGRTGRVTREGREVPERGYGRVRGWQGPELLLPRDEHAAAGGASGHGGDHRAGPGRTDDPRRCRRETPFGSEGRE